MIKPLQSFNRLQNFVQSGGASVIVGGQFGSEAKGLAAAIVARQALGLQRNDFPVICTTNAGAQAGHTTILEDGTKFVCYHLPTIGVMNPQTSIYLNAGSIIDYALLDREIKSVAHATGEGSDALRGRIFVHPNAAVISDGHRQAEAGTDARGGPTTYLGSTMKGVGAALAAKIMRQPCTVAKQALPSGLVRAVKELDLNLQMLQGAAVTIEIPQGTGLSINASSYYPYCTSRDCWVGAGLTDAGIHPNYLREVLMVQRTFPIRVGHIYDQTGQRIGDSGPFAFDSEELNWEKDFPGVVPERTTVTQRVRRIATWSSAQYAHAFALNLPTIVLTTFINYLNNDVERAERMVLGMRSAHTKNHTPEMLWSWGPKVNEYSRSLFEAMADGMQ
jgi:adenylosuccinate synthase